MFNVRIVGPEHWDNAVALTAGRVVAAFPAVFYVAVGSNDGPDQWIQLFDKASAPSAGAVPIMQMKVSAGMPFYFDYPPYGRRMSLGIWVGNSTTASLYTAGAANLILDVGYRARD